MKKILYKLTLSVTVILTSCVNLEPDFTNQENYFFKTRISNDLEIYANRPSEGNLSTFSFRDQSTKPYWITGLALTQFKGDSVYDQIELQNVEYAGGKGVVALIYRTDKTLVDVYYPTDIPLLKSEYEKMINHAEMHPANFHASFIFDNDGFKMTMQLTDKYGRNIKMYIAEKHSKCTPATFIAPIGSGIQNPQYFPLLYMKDMIFLSKSGSDYSLTLAEKKMKPAVIPFSTYRLTRYSHSVISAEWLPNTDTIMQLKDGNHSGETTNGYINNYGYRELSYQEFDYHGKVLTINFSPAIPDLVALKNNIQLEGKFCVNSSSNEGVMAGTYHLIKSGKTIGIEVHPEKGWQPNPGKLWMATYRWKAKLEELTDSTYHFESDWSRTE